MKAPFFALLAAALLTLSCQSNPTENTATTTESLPAAGATPTTQTGELVGKRVAEIKQMGRYNCSGIGLEEVAGGAMYYSVQWAPERGSCFKGKNLITIEKILSGDGSFTEDRMVEAELAIYPEEGEVSYTTVPLSLAGKPKQFYVVEYTGKGYETITHITKLWRMNLEGKTFDETPVPTDFSFVNPYQIEGQ